MRRLLAASAFSLAALLGAPALAQSPMVGSWAAAAETPMGKFESTLTVTEADGAYTVVVEDAPPPAAPGGAPAGPPMPAPEWTISDVAADGNTFSFKRSAEVTGPDGAATPIEITYALAVDGDAFSGTATVSFGGQPGQASPFNGARK